MLSLCVVVVLDSGLAGVDDLYRCLLRRFSEHFKNDDGIVIYAEDDPPMNSRVHDPQLVTTGADGRHRSGVWHFKRLPVLKPSKKEPGFKACIP